ncbi:FAF1 Protein FAF1 [Candida maltosa Xu316]
MGDEQDDYIKALEIQRRNFEAQFGSIEDLGFEDKSKTQTNSESINEDENEEHHRFDSDSEEINQFDESEPESSSSDDEPEIKPKIVRLNDTSTSRTPMVSKREKRLLKSGRAPTLQEITQREKNALKHAPKPTKEDDENLQNDLKLQRLLKESHILANSLEYSGADLTLQTIDFDDPTGKARKRALTSRMREISSINSTGMPKKLENMPMAMRKGMVKKREDRIRKYEEDARNAGIVLSKVRKGELRDLNAGKGSTMASDRIGTGKKVTKRVRDRGLKINGIGRSTRNGLVISQGEIDRISGNGGHKNNNKRKRR